MSRDVLSSCGAIGDAADLREPERRRALSSAASPCRPRARRIEKRADVGNAWWLLCSSSPATKHPERPEVRRGVVGLEISVALRVAQAVDDAGGKERHVRELQRDHDDAGHAEQHEIGDDEQRDAEIATRRDDGRDCSRASRSACPSHTSRASRGRARTRGRARRLRSNTFFRPKIRGLCGSPSFSQCAWCLRCTATHSRVDEPVFNQSQKRQMCRTTGCRSTARCAWSRW